MKHLLTYIKQEELKRSLRYIIAGICIGLIANGISLLVGYMRYEPGKEPFRFELAGSVPFFFIAVFFGCSFLPRIFKIHMQFSISRKTAIKVILTYSILFILVCVAAGLSLDALYSKILETDFYTYRFTTFLSDFVDLSRDNMFRYVLLSFLFSAGFLSGLMFLFMTFMTLAYFLPAKYISIGGFLFYFLIIFCAQDMEKPFKAFINKTGVGPGITILLSALVVIELTVITLCYRRIKCQDKQIIT